MPLNTTTSKRVKVVLTLYDELKPFLPPFPKQFLNASNLAWYNKRKKNQMVAKQTVDALLDSKLLI